MTVIMVAAVVALPLVFVPGLVDGYAFPKATVLRVFGIAGAVGFLGYVVSRGSLGRIVDLRIDLPLACFAGLLVVATVGSVDPVQSFAGEPYQYQGLMTVLVYIGSFFVARLSLGNSCGFRTILTAIACTGALVASYGIAQWLGFDPFWSGPPEDRIISSVGQANDLAAYLDLVVIAALGLWPSAGKGSRLGLAALMVVSVAAIALTFSRGGYLALAVALIVMLLPGIHTVHRRWVGAIGLTLAAMLVMTFALPATRAIAERIVDRVAASADLGDGSIQMHLDLWWVGTQVALDHPLLGTGPETFPLVVPPYLNQALPPERAQFLGRFRLESPHNELIGVAAEMGLPALAVYVVFLLACATACVRRAREANDMARSIALVVLATLATHVVTTFFMTPAIATTELFWMTTGAGLAAIRTW